MISSVIKAAGDGQRRFNRFFDTFAEQLGITVTDADRTAFWNVLRSLGRCLEGFVGDDKKALIKIIGDIMYDHQIFTDPGMTSYRDQVLRCICIGHTMELGR